MKRTNITRHISLLAVGLLVIGVMSGCARGKSTNPLLPTPTSLVGSPTTTTSPAAPRMACADGIMRIGDVPAIDAVWRTQLEISSEDALEWHGDAQLVQLRVSCALFGSGFRMQPSYFSAQAQAIWAEDTRESRPVDLDPEKVHALPLDEISFAKIYDALIRANFTDDLIFDPSTGIDIRLNSAQSPFGPANIPVDALVAHVSIAQSGQVKDLFIDMQTGKVSAFETPK